MCGRGMDAGSWSRDVSASLASRLVQDEVRCFSYLTPNRVTWEFLTPKSYFFRTPDNRPATAFYREHCHSEAPRRRHNPCHDGSGTILSGSMRCTRWTWKRYGNSSSFGRYGVPTSSDQPSLAGGNSLRGEKKKQTSRCNLGVKWMVGIAAFAAIAFIRRRLSGHATLELIRAILSQRRRRRQLPFEDPFFARFG